MAERITRGATRSGRKGAVVLALRGDLGTGKTTFAQGFLKGLGVKKRVASPTFVIIRRRALRRSHSARRKVFTNIFHIDAYRLKSAAHLAALGFKEILADPGNIVLIEWAERAKKTVPKRALWLTFLHGKRENERSIIITQPIEP